MRKHIFSEHERELLENFLTNTGNDNDPATSKALQKIKQYKALFEDVYLYLKIRKTMIE